MTKKYLNNIDLNGTLTIQGSGGTNGYFLKTDGSGNISWASLSGSLGYVGGYQTTAAAGTSVALTGINSLTSTSTLTLTTPSIGASGGTGSSTTLTSGSVTVSNASGSSTSGNTVITSGAATLSNAGNSSGTATAGNISLDTGLASAANGLAFVNQGSISIGAVNSTQIQIGNSTSTTLLGGQTTYSAGTSSFPPIKLTSGTNTASAIAGAIEYNGDLLTLVHSGTAAGRNMVQATAWAYSNANSTPATTTTPVSIFQAGAQKLTLEAGKTYYFKLNLGFIATFTSGTASIQLVPTFSNAPVSINYTALYHPGTAGNAQAYRVSSTTATAISPSITATQTNAGVIVEGYFQSNATTGGTVEFKFQMSTTGSSTVVINGSYQQITKIGTGVPAVVSGAWA